MSTEKSLKTSAWQSFAWSILLLWKGMYLLLWSCLMNKVRSCIFFPLIKVIQFTDGYQSRGPSNRTPNLLKLTTCQYIFASFTSENADNLQCTTLGKATLFWGLCRTWSCEVWGLLWLFSEATQTLFLPHSAVAEVHWFCLVAFAVPAELLSIGLSNHYFLSPVP